MTIESIAEARTAESSRAAAGTQPYEDANARANLYRFLSTAYLRPPTSEFVSPLHDGRLLRELATLFSQQPAAEDHKDETVDVAELRQDYMDLFAAPTGRYVTPFEDVYAGGPPSDEGAERGLLLGPRAVAVTRIYREAGARMDSECKELPTHIGVELGFMSFLCDGEASALRLETASSPRGAATPVERDSSRCRAIQGRFLNDHLTAWFPRLGRAIQSRARTRLYRDLALLTEAFLIWDASCLMSPRPGDAFFQPSDGSQSNRLSLER